MSGYGLDTDIMGLGDTNLTLVKTTKVPRPKSVASAVDSLGNVAGETPYGSVDIYAVQCDYVLKSGTKNLNTIKLGQTDTTGTVVRESVDVGTSNTALPTISVKGQSGAKVGADGPTFTLPAITISGVIAAQGLGFSMGAATCKLTSSTLTASGKIVDGQLDSAGNVPKQAFTGATVEVSGSAVEITDAVSVTWDTTTLGLQEIQQPGADKSNVDYGNATFSARKFLVKDT